MAKAIDPSDVHKPISTASKQVQQIIRRVLEIEKERLDKNERSPINDEILKIIKEAIQ